MDTKNLPTRPSKSDYQAVLEHFYVQLKKSRYPIKQIYLWCHYKDTVHKNKVNCPVVAYWLASGDNFGLPPEISLMLKFDPRFIRLSYTDRDIYYDVTSKNIRGTGLLKKEEAE